MRRTVAAQLIFDLLRQGFLLLNAEGCVQESNGAASRFLGQTAAAVKGKRLLDLFPPESGERIARKLQSLVETGKPARLSGLRLPRPGAGRIRAELILLAPQGLGEVFPGAACAALIRRSAGRSWGEQELSTVLLQNLQAIASNPDLDGTLAFLLEQLKKVIDYQIGIIGLIDEKTEELVLRVQKDYTGRLQTQPSSIITRLALREAKGISARAIRSGKALYVRDVAEDPWYVPLGSGFKSGSEMASPIKVKGRTIGVINVEKEALNGFHKGDLELLAAFSNQAASVVENARLVSETHERLKEVTTLYRASQACLNISNLPLLLASILEAAAEASGAEFGSIMLRDEQRGEYGFGAQYGFSPRSVERLKTQMNIPIGAGLVGAVETAGRPLIIPDVRRDPRWIGMDLSEMQTSFLGVPLIGQQGRSLGIVTLSHSEEGRFNDHHGQLLAAFANQASIAVENASLVEKLRESERKYRTVVENATEWIWTLDREGRFTFINQAAEKASGYRSKEWLGKPFSPLIHPEDLARVVEGFRKTLAGEAQNSEVRVVSADGRTLFLDVNTVPILEGQEIVGIQGLCRDVTEQKRLVEQLQHAQKMEAVGNLAGGIAHDFNNILGGILGYTSLILSELPAGDPLRKDMETIAESVHRAANLTAQLLAFASGGLLQRAPVNLNHTVEEVLKLLSRTVDKRIRVETRLEERLQAVQGDPTQLQQVLLNLCLNARDAMTAGGTLTLGTANTSLAAEGGSQQPFVLVTVQDTGSGIDAEARSHIFEPFFTTKREAKGPKHSGLGLSTVYGLVRGHDGRIEFDSEPGRGTTFRLYLPAEPEPALAGQAESRQAAERRPPLQGGAETILVVDDEEVLRTLLKRMLTNAGYTVLTAGNGREALRIFQEQGERIDLLILDMVMPELNGLETLRELRKTHPRTPVLLCSGYSSDGRSQDLQQAGIRGYFQKPYALDQLLSKIREVLGR